MTARLSPTEIFNGRKIFLIGGTGFLGKVTLSMLLHRFPNVGGVIAEDNLGFSEEEAEAIAKDIDVVINSAGNVTFNPTLESGLRTNVVGTQNVIAFARRMKRPALVHVSTCFVAGNRSGAVWESDPVLGYFPRKNELEGVDFSVDKEIDDCAKLSERVREEARDAMMVARFRDLARKRLNDEGRDSDDPDAMGLAVARERKVWIRTRLTDLGVERAAWWGWPNIYTYTKALGEQLVAAETGMVRSIVRPSIVESALSYPFPGWNEGFTTTAPIIFLVRKGQTKVPANEKLILDITPVDQIASVMLAVAAQACVAEPKLVYQVATGDSNPNNMGRIIELVGLDKRRHYREKETGLKFLNQIASHIEPRPVSNSTFERTSIPAMNSVARKASSLLDRARPRWGGGRVVEVIDRVKTGIDRLEELTGETVEAFEMFRPFTIENAYVFRSDNVRSLFERIREEERSLLTWHPEQLDWYDYWLNVHLPGLTKWVFPTLEEDMREQPKRVYTYRDLLELFETSTKRHATRVAMRIERDGRKEQYTYADLRELATRAAGFFASEGIKHGDRVMLVSQNAPEWGMTYFGVLKAGATCIPVDPESSTDEIINFAAAGDAVAIILSDKLKQERSALPEQLEAAGLTHIKLWTFDEVFEVLDEQIESDRIAMLPARVTA